MQKYIHLFIYSTAIIVFTYYFGHILYYPRIFFTLRCFNITISYWNIYQI